MNVNEMSQQRKELLVMLSKIPEDELGKVKKALVNKPANHTNNFIIPKDVAEKYKRLKAESNGILGSKADADDTKWCSYIEKLSTLDYQVPNIPANASDKEIYRTVLSACIDNNMPVDFCGKATSIVLEYIRTGAQNKPVILVGPPGCGKTEAFKIICEKILDLKINFIPAAASRRGRGLFGADPNYKGADIGQLVNGLFTTGVLNPVILVDEVEKVVNIKDDVTIEDELLSVFNDKNRIVSDNFLDFPISFKRSLWVFTCNNLEDLSEPFVDRCSIVEFHHTEEERMRKIITAYAEKEIATYKDSLKLDEELLCNAIESLYCNDIFSIRKHQELFDEAKIKAYTEFLKSDGENPILIDKRHYDKAIAEIARNKPKTSKIGF